MTQQPRPKVLFPCTGNSCRSQMAQGWTKALHGDCLDAYSAGIEKHGLNPHAVQVMAEAEVDITAPTSNTVAELGQIDLGLVITVCGHADEHCPTLSSAHRKSCIADSTIPRNWPARHRRKRSGWYPTGGGEMKSEYLSRRCPICPS